MRWEITGSVQFVSLSCAAVWSRRLDLYQPINVVAVGAAAEAVVVIWVDVQARRCFGVERAADLAVAAPAR